MTDSNIQPPDTGAGLPDSVVPGTGVVPSVVLKFESVIFISLFVIFSSRFLYSQCTPCSAYRYHVHLTFDVSEQQYEDPLSVRELSAS